MSISKFSVGFALLSLASVCQVGYANASGNAISQDQSSVEIDDGNTLYFFGVRPWITSWDVPLVDMKTVVVNPIGPVVAMQEVSVQVESDTSTIPVVFIGVRHGDYTLTASYSPRVSYSTSGLVAGDVSRSEADISLGYSFTPNIVGSLAYKRGKVDRALTNSAVTVAGSNFGYTVDGILAGISVSAPLHGNYSLYGNFAIGPAKEKTDAGQEYDGTYKIGEIGISRKLLDHGESSFVKGLSLQIGYRFQNVAIKDIKFGTYSIPAGTLIAQESKDVSSNTHGFVLGLIGVF